MKILKKILLILLYIVLSIIVAFNMYNYICLNICEQDIATVNGYGVLEVVSGSMEPTINIGDLIIVDTKVKQVYVGDIITFYDDHHNYVTHRIIDISDGLIKTQGDNNNTPDEHLITRNDVVAIYKGRIKNAGRIMTSFKSPFVMITILIIGIIVCFLISTDKFGNPIITPEEKEFREFKEYKKNKEKEDKNKGEIKKEVVKKITTKKTTNKKSK